MICFLSEKGHNNFYYATETAAWILKGAPLEHISWVSGHNERLQAVKVKKKFIIPLTLDDICVNNVINSDEYIVVWINKGD